MRAKHYEDATSELLVDPVIHRLVEAWVAGRPPFHLTPDIDSWSFVRAAHRAYVELSGFGAVECSIGAPAEAIRLILREGGEIDTDYDY